MSRRDQIRMSPERISSYVAEQRVINVATMGPNGRPHLAPLWYFPRGEGVATWTYGKSQKAANLRRDPQATVLIESGDSYEQLRGVSMECDVEIVTDIDTITGIGLELMRRYAPGVDTDILGRIVGAQAVKRVGLVFTPTRIVSWDHSKLGGAY